PDYAAAYLAVKKRREGEFFMFARSLRMHTGILRIWYREWVRRYPFGDLAINGIHLVMSEVPIRSQSEWNERKRKLLRMWKAPDIFFTTSTPVLFYRQYVYTEEEHLSDEQYYNRHLRFLPRSTKFIVSPAILNRLNNANRGDICHLLSDSVTFQFK